MEARRLWAGPGGGGRELFGFRDSERAHRSGGRVRSAELAGNAAGAALAGGVAAAGRTAGPGGARADLCVGGKGVYAGVKSIVHWGEPRRTGRQAGLNT